jgi:hypothetical protein
VALSTRTLSLQFALKGEYSVRPVTSTVHVCLPALLGALRPELFQLARLFVGERVLSMGSLKENEVHRSFRWSA